MPDQYLMEMKAAYKMAININSTTTWLNIFSGPIHFFMRASLARPQYIAGVRGFDVRLHVHTKPGEALRSRLIQDQMLRVFSDL